jgi:hypothetical protein
MAALLEAEIGGKAQAAARDLLILSSRDRPNARWFGPALPRYPGIGAIDVMTYKLSAC